jgi:hypothetical protein
VHDLSELRLALLATPIRHLAPAGKKDRNRCASPDLHGRLTIGDISQYLKQIGLGAAASALLSAVHTAAACIHWEDLEASAGVRPQADSTCSHERLQSSNGDVVQGMPCADAHLHRKLSKASAEVKPEAMSMGSVAQMQTTISRGQPLKGYNAEGVLLRDACMHPKGLESPPEAESHAQHLPGNSCECDRSEVDQSVCQSLDQDPGNAETALRAGESCLQGNACTRNGACSEHMRGEPEGGAQGPELHAAKRVGFHPVPRGTPVGCGEGKIKGQCTKQSSALISDYDARTLPNKMGVHSLEIDRGRALSAKSSDCCSDGSGNHRDSSSYQGSERCDSPGYQERNAAAPDAARRGHSPPARGQTAGGKRCQSLHLVKRRTLVDKGKRIGKTCTSNAHLIQIGLGRAVEAAIEATGLPSARVFLRAKRLLNKSGPCPQNPDNILAQSLGSTAQLPCHPKRQSAAWGQAREVVDTVRHARVVLLRDWLEEGDVNLTNGGTGSNCGEPFTGKIPEALTEWGALVATMGQWSVIGQHIVVEGGTGLQHQRKSTALALTACVVLDVSAKDHGELAAESSKVHIQALHPIL